MSWSLSSHWLQCISPNFLVYIQLPCSTNQLSGIEWQAKMTSLSSPCKKLLGKNQEVSAAYPVLHIHTLFGDVSDTLLFYTTTERACCWCYLIRFLHRACYCGRNVKNHTRVKWAVLLCRHHMSYRMSTPLKNPSSTTNLLSSGTTKYVVFGVGQTHTQNLYLLSSGMS